VLTEDSLFLKVRVHCFHHLVPLGRQAQFWLNGDNQEPDPEIGRLSRDLGSIDEALAAVLQRRKHRVSSKHRNKKKYKHLLISSLGK